MRKNIFSTLLIIIVFSFVACGNTLPKDLKDFTVELDGVTYKLPAEFSEFEEDGWEEVGGMVLNPNEYSILSEMKKGKAEIYVNFFNDNNAAKATSDTKLAGLSVHDTSGVECKLPKGITFGATKEDIIKAYGEPNEIEKYAETIEDLKYQKNKNIKYVFRVEEDKGLILISILNVEK